MNKPAESSSYWSGDVIENFEYYFDITDEKRPLFTPIVFVNQGESCFLKYSTNFTARHHSTSKDIISSFLTGGTHLKKFKIKTNWYLVARGCIFKLEVGEDNIEKLNPIIIFCFDETTNWDAKENYKIVINTLEWNNPVNKTLKPKLSKIVDTYIAKSEVVYTNNLTKYCFNTIGRLKFKSIKEQSEFLSNIAKETLEINIPEVRQETINVEEEEEEEEEVAF